MKGNKYNVEFMDFLHPFSYPIFSLSLEFKRFQALRFTI